MTPHVISGPTISAFVGGDLKTIDASHPNFETIKLKLRTGDDAGLDELFDLASALRKNLLYEDEIVTVGYDTLIFNGMPLHNYLTERIITTLAAGQPATPWLNFLKRVQMNPDPEVRDNLFEWLEAGGMPITPDGYFLAYKKVRDDYLSYHDGETNNRVGTTVFLPREECDPDRFRTCSSGLHFCSWSYLPHYNGSQGRVLVLKINPADVVAFPSDHEAKGRACRYTIVDEVPEHEAEHAFPKPVYATVYDDWEDDTPTVGILGRITAWFKRRLN